MDVLDLARTQFAVTGSLHFLFVVLTLGLAPLVAIMHTRYAVTGKPIHERMTRFWGQIYVINYALGIFTGLVMEFQFGLSWSGLSHYAGDIFGAPLAIETLGAFFLESTFLGLWIFGWHRLPKWLHLACIWLVTLTAYVSAFWIMTANSFLQNPAGAVERGGRLRPDRLRRAAHQPHADHGAAARDRRGPVDRRLRGDGGQRVPPVQEDLRAGVLHALAPPGGDHLVRRLADHGRLRLRPVHAGLHPPAGQVRGLGADRSLTRRHDRNWAAAPVRHHVRADARRVLAAALALGATDPDGDHPAAVPGRDPRLAGPRDGPATLADLRQADRRRRPVPRAHLRDDHHLADRFRRRARPARRRRLRPDRPYRPARSRPPSPSARTVPPTPPSARTRSATRERPWTSSGSACSPSC